ncbi:MAG: hypothetical protein LBN09_01740 [Clostridioides sp.]|nr:hypothetical protein [Clostridioides sp.]
MKRVLKIFIKSALICFPITLVLAIANSIMGVSIGLNYYFSIGLLAQIGLTFCLTICNAQKIFAGHKAIKRPVRRSVPQRSASSSTMVRRKIS